VKKKENTGAPDIVELARECARLLREKKAEDTLLLNLLRVNTYLDYFIITTGNSFIHCRALAREVQKFFGNAGVSERVKSRLDSSWIVLDYNEIVVHIFTEQTREYYQLEKLWADAEHLSFG